MITQKIVDGQLIDLTPDELAQLQQAQTQLPSATLADILASLAQKVDAQAVAIVQKPMTLSREYEARKADAQAYTDAGYTGIPGQYLKDFADPAGLTYQAAAQRVLTQAAAFADAEPKIAQQRMRKYEILLASTVEYGQAIYSDITAKLAALQQLIS